MNLRRNGLRVFLLALALLSAAMVGTTKLHAATFVVVNNDAAGVGFNETTAAAPVGGNSGVTIGAQRLIAFQYAANIWGGLLFSSVPIRVGANFGPLTCTATSGILGSAGPNAIFKNFTGAPLAATYYPVALANALHGSDLDPVGDDIDASFNSAIGTPGCLASSGWYLGLDGNPPSGKIDFVSVLLHELGHGLGFLTFVDLATGAKLGGVNDPFMLNLEDHGATPSSYASMTDAQRIAASIDSGSLHWVGGNVRAASGVLSAGKVGDHVRMYAPNPLVGGSSVSHWDTALVPNQIMEPSYTGPLHSPVLELPLFQDIGWVLQSATVPGSPTIGTATPGSASASVAFTAPGSDGGAAIDNYRATCGSTSATGSGSPISVTGLTAGTPYTCTVAAHNVIGWSVESAASNAVTPLAPSPDLIVTSVTAPASGQAGGGIAVAATVKNQGTAGAGASRVKFYLSTSSVITPSGIDTTYGCDITSLAVGQTYLCQGTIVIPAATPAGTYYVGAIADANGQVAEFNKNNNTMAAANTTVISLLALPVCNLTASPALIAAGGSSVLSASCSPAATSYVWTGGACAGTLGSNCIVTPSATTTYTVAGVNGAGTGAAVAATVTVSTVSTVRLINLSTRGQVQTGDNVMIGGFIIQGSTPKTVLIRAVGPNLANYGVAGVLANPKLELHNGSGAIIASNDNWQDTNAAAIQASGLAPVSPFESAILATLSPGAYTAIVSGFGGGTGVGMVEVYEIDHPEIPLVNISTRGQVQTGDNVMIGGFIIQGAAAQTVLIRASGPSLLKYGVTGVLANPMLTLYSGQTAIASNDDWGTATNAAAIQATGLAPASPLESAILITLPPGAYTAIVSGSGGGSGVGIIEVFAQ